MTEEAKTATVPAPPKYRAVAKLSFATYEEAKAEFDAWTRVQRKRIGKRGDGTFDVIEFVEIKAKEGA